MGRRSKLTNAQWAEVVQRRLCGESGRSLAREFGVTETAIRKHITLHPWAKNIPPRQRLTGGVVVIVVPISAQISSHYFALP